MWFGFILGEIISGLVLSNAQTVLADTCGLIGSSQPDEQVDGCPAKIPLIQNKTLVAARIYSDFGNDVPSLACNGACTDYSAETKFTQGVTDAFAFGSVIVNPGCTIYVFSDELYRGTSKKFEPGLYTNIKTESPFYSCLTSACAKSMLFTCQQVLPSCTPSSDWVTVTTLDNSNSTVATDFSYKKTIGTKFTEAMTASFGTSLTVKEELQESFYGLFKQSTSISATINFDWKTMDTEETSTDTSYTVDVTLPAGLKVFIQEVVGTCDGSKIHTQMFKVVDSHTNDTLHIYTGKMSNFVVNIGKFYSMGTSAYGTESSVVTGIGYCCPKITVWGNLDPDKNGIYLNNGRRSFDEFPNECNSDCVYVKKNSVDNNEYCFGVGDFWTQSQCETMDNGTGSGSNVG